MKILIISCAPIRVIFQDLVTIIDLIDFRFVLLCTEVVKLCTKLLCGTYTDSFFQYVS